MGGATAGRRLAVNRYAPTLLDKLLGDAGDGAATVPRWTLDRVRQALARDLERLLNTRAAWSPDELRRWPRAARSVLAIGMADTSTACLANDRDRRRIAAGIRETLAAHDRRLTDIEVRVRGHERGALAFAISARLRLQPAAEPVRFDAVLVPGARRYAVAAAERG
ncbi:MAG: type VI secretion system baseplate subunit TssE [Comamonadaceae bacterium]|nr:type VI secretion system baseplate subunit TssE [Comamonadaceae bacterium]